MGLVELLKKLGILRYGSWKGEYKNAKERAEKMPYDDLHDIGNDTAFSGDAEGESPGEWDDGGEDDFDSSSF